MNNDILSFTKNISGIDLVDYVINYIDQNMIAYNILKDIDHSISSCVNGTSIIYDLGQLQQSDIDRIRSLPEQQTISIYGKTYKVEISIQDNYNRLYISVLS